MDLLTHLLHYFFVVLLSFFIIPLCLYPLSLSSHFSLCHEWWSFTFQCMDDGHVPFRSYVMDTGLEIFSWEGHLIKESSCTLLFESIFISLCILRGSLSSPLLHTLVIWLFSMIWFEWISAHSFSFDLLVLLMIFHSPCLHCSLFIVIYILCSIFSIHHSCTSHQQFNIFLSSLSSLIYSSLILSSSLIYSYWTSPNPWFMRLSVHIAFYTWGYKVLSLGLLSLVSLHFFTLLP